MHKNWVIKGYDQSVTWLADDLKTLVTHSSTLRTPGTLSQTNDTYIRNQARVHEIKLKIRDLTRKFNLRTPVSKTKSIQTKQRRSNGERNKLRVLIWI